MIQCTKKTSCVEVLRGGPKETALLFVYMKAFIVSCLLCVRLYNCAAAAAAAVVDVRGKSMAMSLTIFRPSCWEQMYMICYHKEETTEIKNTRTSTETAMTTTPPPPHPPILTIRQHQTIKQTTIDTYVTTTKLQKKNSR